MNQPINLEKILKNHKSGWVAVSKDYKEVVATGQTIKEVTDNLEKTGKEGVLVPAADNYQNFVT
ncbi:MAG: hypothetical protein A3A57_01205 [Candidatus Woykebacteria bacterium RIFCSPLOWO2_01_FULL_41_12]|uniref:DUF5678 domain-containing protein n=1 Tax=Candidatus Woykebacteria bacterium RIFCSPLOWO2_01_FULL_41_12 TaxID=1802604 RepID=A0A1G1WY08_9BACT|nr:MAG: hypothetical protein A3A57_01205 [Candidatus Woykebacteria bacterium RIFCSPLOWO2_01_FULL_41_12]